MAFISRSMHTRVYQAQTVLKVNAACRRNKVKVQGPRTSTEKFLKTVTKTTSFAGVSAFPSPMKTLAFINARLFMTVPIVQEKKRSNLVQCVHVMGPLKSFLFPSQTLTAGTQTVSALESKRHNWVQSQECSVQIFQRAVTNTHQMTRGTRITLGAEESLPRLVRDSR